MNEHTELATPKEADHLRHLLTAFDVQTLGQGDALAGANLLAAMAVSLSNLARPGSGITTPEGTRRLQVGCHLLASGSLLTSLVHDEVVTPIGRCQSNLLRQLSRLLKNDAKQEEQAARGIARKWRLSDRSETNASEDSLFNLMMDNSGSETFSGIAEDGWACVVAEPPVNRLEDLVRCPRAFIAAFSPDHLKKQIIGTHRGEALVAIGLHRSGDAARFGELCPALMDGLVPAGPAGAMVRGRLLVTVPERILREAATAPGEKTTWLARLPWLVEGEAGPELPSLPQKNGGITLLPKLEERFEQAVQKLFGNRLNDYMAAPVVLKADIWDSQCRWNEELRSMERNLPGITGTARTLFASLVFGLHRLATAMEAPKDFRYSIKGVEAFARFLVRRMATYRAAMLFSAEEAWKLQHKRRILAKLADGRLDTRAIYRPLHLTAGLCEHLLSEMDRDGLVERSGRKWARVEGAALPDGPAGHLPFEV